MIVKGSLTGDKYQLEVQMGKHQMLVDEPIEKGGADEAPSPMDLILAALVSCTNITLKMYAKTKDYPLETVDVSVVATVEAGTGRLLVKRQITLHGPLTDAQKDILLGIANRCPVHRVLSPQNEIVTTLA